MTPSARRRRTPQKSPMSSSISAERLNRGKNTPPTLVAIQRPKGKTLPSPPMTALWADDSAVTRLSFNSPGTPPKPKITELPDRNDPMFMSAFQDLVDQVTPEDAPAFFALVFDGSRKQMMPQMVAAIALLLEEDVRFVDAFIQAKGFGLLAFDDANSFEFHLRIVLAGLWFLPGQVPVTAIQNLLQHVTNNEIRLFSLLTTSHSMDESSVKVYTQFLAVADIYLASPTLAIPFISQYFSAASHYAAFSEVCFQVSVRAISVLADDVVIAGYESLCQLHFDPKELPLDVIVSHLGDMTLSKYALSLLCGLEQPPISEGLVAALLAAWRCQLSPCLLMKVGHSPEGARILVRQTDWLNPQHFMLHIRWRVFLLLFAHSDVRAAVVSDDRIPSLFNEVAASGGSEAISSTVTVIRRVENTDEFVQRLSQAGFFRQFIQVMFGEGSPDVWRTAFVLFDTIARSCYIDDYLAILPYLGETLSMGSQVQASAMSAIIVLAGHEPVAKMLPKYRVPELVASFVLASNYEVYRESFLDRFPAGS
jgi:hypothetical protein